MDASESARRVVETERRTRARSARTRRPWSRTASSTAAARCRSIPQSGELIDGGIAEQAARCLESLDAVCRAAGTRLQDAARIGIYLTDMEEFPKVNDVYATFFEQPFPVRTTVGVAALPKGALVEMDATVPLAGPLRRA